MAARHVVWTKTSCFFLTPYFPLSLLKSSQFHLFCRIVGAGVLGCLGKNKWTCCALKNCLFNNIILFHPSHFVTSTVVKLGHDYRQNVTWPFWSFLIDDILVFVDNFLFVERSRTRYRWDVNALLYYAHRNHTTTHFTEWPLGIRQKKKNILLDDTTKENTW